MRENVVFFFYGILSWELLISSPFQTKLIRYKIDKFLHLANIDTNRSGSSLTGRMFRHKVQSPGLTP